MNNEQGLLNVKLCYGPISPTKNIINHSLRHWLFLGNRPSGKTYNIIIYPNGDATPIFATRQIYYLTG
jgi:hypothetical protein